jgi:hypothetical protein
MAWVILREGFLSPSLNVTHVTGIATDFMSYFLISQSFLHTQLCDGCSKSCLSGVGLPLQLFDRPTHPLTIVLIESCLGSN